MGSKYTKSELEYLKESYGKTSISEIASNLDRSEDAIAMKASRLELTEDIGYNGNHNSNTLDFTHLEDYTKYIEEQKYNNKEFCLFISGLVTAEGFFSTSESHGQFRAQFGIGMADRDEKTLQNIAYFFNRETHISRREEQKDHANTIHFRISSIKDIVEKIIPFFETYPPRGKNIRNI